MLSVGALDYGGLTCLLVSYYKESLVYCGFMNGKAVFSGNGVTLKVR